MNELIIKENNSERFKYSMYVENMDILFKARKLQFTPGDSFVEFGDLKLTNEERCCCLIARYYAKKDELNSLQKSCDKQLRPNNNQFKWLRRARKMKKEPSLIREKHDFFYYEVIRKNKNENIFAVSAYSKNKEHLLLDVIIHGNPLDKLFPLENRAEWEFGENADVMAIINHPVFDSDEYATSNAIHEWYDSYVDKYCDLI